MFALTSTRSRAIGHRPPRATPAAGPPPSPRPARAPPRSARSAPPANDSAAGSCASERTKASTSAWVEVRIHPLASATVGGSATVGAGSAGGVSCIARAAPGRRREEERDEEEATGARGCPGVGAQAPGGGGRPGSWRIFAASGAGGSEDSEPLEPARAARRGGFAPLPARAYTTDPLDRTPVVRRPEVHPDLPGTAPSRRDLPDHEGALAVSHPACLETLPALLRRAVRFVPRGPIGPAHRAADRPRGLTDVRLPEGATRL